MLGNLFNKEAVLTALLNPTAGFQEEFPHIKSLKDIKTLNFHSADSDNSDAGNNFVCPVTTLEFNGLNSFYCIWTTGFVISEKAIRELGIESLQSEYGPFVNEDLIKLLPNEEELLQLKEKLLEKKRIEKLNKKDKKKKRSSDESQQKEIVDSNIDNSEGKITEDDQVPKKSKKESISAQDSIVKKAVENIQSNSSSSDVYKKLFHKDGEKDRHDRDLFMTVAGFRYTLG